MKKALMGGFVMLFAAGVMGCSSSSSKDDCGDVARMACQKAYDCGYVYFINGIPVSVDSCTNIKENEAAANGISDQQCRDVWAEGEDLACSDYQAWFND